MINNRQITLDTVTFEFAARPFWGVVLILGILLCSALVFAALPKVNTPLPIMEKLRNEVGLAILPAPIFVIVTLLWCTLAGILLLGLLAQIWEIISTAAPTADSSFEWRFAMVRLTALTATFGAVIALPFTIVRLVYMRRQTETAAETLVSDKEALFNDKINTAASDLHAQRQITKWKNGEADNGWEDDVTRRNGAIDRLLGLAKEEPESAPRIARMLSVYVKELSREYPAKAPPQTDDFILLKEWADNLTFARSDMQNAVQVLGKLREESGQPLNIWDIDLSGTNLQGFDLQFLDFENVSFIKAHLQGANLLHAQSQGANLTDVDLQGADLWDAHLQTADLWDAQLQGADCRRAGFQGADLWDAKFDSATTLRDANLSYASLRGVDFSKTKITQEQLNSAFGDSSVILPSGKGPNDPEWPDHWSKEELKLEDFRTQWRAFQEAGGFDPNNPN